MSLNLPPAIPSEELIPVNKVWQTLKSVFTSRQVWPRCLLRRSMFIGEFGCCLPLIWRYFTSNPKRSPFSKATNDSQGYTQVAQDEGEPTPAMDVDEHLTGWRIGLLWFPAFCDSELSAPIALRKLKRRSLRHDPDECRLDLVSCQHIPNVSLDLSSRS